MRVAIINCFSPERLSYETVLNQENIDVVMFTKLKFKEYYLEKGILTFGYEDFDNDGNIYLDFIKEHQKEKFDSIIATHEFDIERAACLREYLNISGQSYKSGMQFRDKYLMKKALVGVINIPEFAKVSHPLDILDFIKKHGYPIVIKPRMGAGSVNICILRNDEELSSFLKKPLNKELMVEKFVEGEMYHVDGLFKEGCLVYSQPSKYINTCLSFEEDYALGSFQLHRSNELYETLNKSVSVVLNTLNTPEHVIPFHAEFFVNKDVITFCEIASRVGGGMINEASLESDKIDLITEGIFGQIFKNREIIKVNSALTGWVMIPPKKGVLKKINISKEAWIVENTFKMENINKEFFGGDSSASQIVSYLVKGTSEQEVQDRIKELISWQEENMVWVLEEENNDKS